MTFKTVKARKCLKVIRVTFKVDIAKSTLSTIQNFYTQIIAHNIAIRLQLQFSQFTTTRLLLGENTTYHLSFSRPRCLSLTTTTTWFKVS